MRIFNKTNFFVLALLLSAPSTALAVDLTPAGAGAAPDPDKSASDLVLPADLHLPEVPHGGDAARGRAFFPVENPTFVFKFPYEGGSSTWRNAGGAEVGGEYVFRHRVSNEWKQPAAKTPVGGWGQGVETVVEPEFDGDVGEYRQVHDQYLRIDRWGNVLKWKPFAGNPADTKNGRWTLMLAFPQDGLEFETEVGRFRWEAVEAGSVNAKGEVIAPGSYRLQFLDAQESMVRAGHPGRLAAVYSPGLGMAQFEHDPVTPTEEHKRLYQENIMQQRLKVLREAGIQGGPAEAMIRSEYAMVDRPRGPRVIPGPNVPGPGARVIGGPSAGTGRVVGGPSAPAGQKTIGPAPLPAGVLSPAEAGRPAGDAMAAHWQERSDKEAVVRRHDELQTELRNEKVKKNPDAGRLLELRVAIRELERGIFTPLEFAQRYPNEPGSEEKMRAAGYSDKEIAAARAMYVTAPSVQPEAESAILRRLISDVRAAADRLFDLQEARDVLRSPEERAQAERAMRPDMTRYNDGTAEIEGQRHGEGEHRDEEGGRGRGRGGPEGRERGGPIR